MTPEELVRAVLAQDEPTGFEIALVKCIEELENQLENALNDLTAVHAGGKRETVGNTSILEDIAIPDRATFH